MALSSRVLPLLHLLLKLFLYPIHKCLTFVIALLRKDIEHDYSCDVVLITGAAQGIGKALANEVSFTILRYVLVYRYRVYFIVCSSWCHSNIIGY